MRAMDRRDARMSAKEETAQQVRDAAALLESMADDIAGDIGERLVLPPIAITVEVGSGDGLPTLSVRKDYLARKREP